MAQNSKIKTIDGTVTITSGQTGGNSADLPSSVNGIVRAIYIDAPDMTGTSYTVTVVGAASGMTLFTQATLTKNTQTTITVDANNYPLQFPVDGAIGFDVASTGAEGADRAFSFKLLIEQ